MVIILLTKESLRPEKGYKLPNIIKIYYVILVFRSNSGFVETKGANKPILRHLMLYRQMEHRTRILKVGYAPVSISCGTDGYPHGRKTGSGHRNDHPECFGVLVPVSGVSAGIYAGLWRFNVDAVISNLLQERVAPYTAARCIHDHVLQPLSPLTAYRSRGQAAKTSPVLTGGYLLSAAMLCRLKFKNLHTEARRHGEHRGTLVYLSPCTSATLCLWVRFLLTRACDTRSIPPLTGNPHAPPFTHTPTDSICFPCWSVW